MNSLKQLAAMYGDDDDNDEEEEASKSFSVEIDKRGIKRSREDEKDENVLHTSEQDKSRYCSQTNILRQVSYIFRRLCSSVFHSSSICFYQ